MRRDDHGAAARTIRQPALWGELDRDRRERAWKVMDKLNATLGRDTVRILGAGPNDAAWKAQSRALLAAVDHAMGRAAKGEGSLEILGRNLLKALALLFLPGNPKHEVHVMISSASVMTLWAKLESMEQERRFNGASYPAGIARFPFRLKGQGFFPGGDGLWRDVARISEPSSGSVGLNGVVFLGNDFGYSSELQEAADKWV